jgi:hypothetical protein
MEDCPQLYTSASMYSWPFRAARECEAIRPEIAREGDRAPAPKVSRHRASARAVAEPAGKPNKGSGWNGRAAPLSAKDSQDRESCGEEERGTQKA